MAEKLPSGLSSGELTGIVSVLVHQCLVSGDLLEGGMHLMRPYQSLTRFSFTLALKGTTLFRTDRSAVNNQERNKRKMDSTSRH